MLFRYSDGELEPVRYFDYAAFEGKEKDLENLLADNISGNLYFDEDFMLMPIFQEKQGLSAPDLCALDKEGNMVIFELKRGAANSGAIQQIMGYAQVFGQMKYDELNDKYKNYMYSKGSPENAELELNKDHAENFGLLHELDKASFNRKQKLVIVGNEADLSLVRAIDYWKRKNIDIDFMPYRFYQIGDEIFFEFFAKPYDYHVNLAPDTCKGIIFDTNLTYSDTNEGGMLERHHVEAYGDVKWSVDSFRKGDYVLFYSRGYGIIAAGKITSLRAEELRNIPDINGRYHEVDMIVPVNASYPEGYSVSIRPFEITELLGHGFYFARTDKRPYLNQEEAEKLIEELKKRYEE